MYKQSEFVANIFVYGDSLQRFLVAIVVPDFDVLTKWASSNGLGSLASDPERLCQHARVQQLLFSDMGRVAKREQLRGFERVERILLIAEEFTQENGLLTPSMKLKRHQAKLHFQQAIQTLYKDDPPQVPSKL